MVAVLSAVAVPAAVDAFAAAGIRASVVGEVVEAEAIDSGRYVEGPLEAVT